MKETCLNCGNSIDIEKEKYVLVGTYNGTGKSQKDEQFFHFQCWIDFFNQKIIDRISIGQKKAMELLGGTIKNLKGAI